ncbi:hypothetical protein QJS10_CPB15g00291 [Acorus calamus]|uniref:Nitrate regulatory gene2 protein n=1 Tax=Acorus calamus TaxID=4465 RepID=A0AAV9D6S2_ACOCL|nr:hypothetical protein QJS10_CPB15g00291 [Acorus calamus]
MGCAGSKLDDLEAVALCKARYELLHEAIDHRFALADAHLAYLHSLRSLALSFHLFFSSSSDAPPSPLLHLPLSRKGDPPADLPSSAAAPPPPAVAFAADAGHSHSNSGSHLHFGSDEDSDEDGSIHMSPLHGGEQELQHQNHFNMNFMKNRAAVPSVSYEVQPPKSPENVRFGEPSSGFYGYGEQNPSFYPPYPYPYSSYASGINGFFGSPPPMYGGGGGSSYPPAPPPMMVGGGGGSPVKEAPPPPPSPPRANTWDFLNPFEAFDSYYRTYTPSRDSKDLREEEGIPDLEEEEEVVKEAYGDKKPVPDEAAVHMKSKGLDESGNGKDAEEAKPSTSGEGVSEVPEAEVTTDKDVVMGEERRSGGGNVAAFVARPGSRDPLEAVAEVKVYFERASDTVNEVSKMLEVGKHPYHRRKYEVVSSKMLNVIVPPVMLVSPQSSASKDAELSFLDLDEDKAMRSGNLSSTLQKLYIWEKKLYEEVKAEEKMRIMHDRKRRRLKRLDERGAEPEKVDAAQTFVRTLSTKIRIAIQVVDSISSKISKLRDEELWPQTYELIHGLLKMYGFMLECHRSQCHAITEARNLDAIASGGRLSDEHMKNTMQLFKELLDWILNFSAWYNAQKGFVKALNGWFLKCIYYEPEETADGVAPFSPGRIGAPPVFVIFNYWSQSIDRISEKEVVEAMEAFAATVHRLWEQHHTDQRMGMLANKDMERRLKSSERDEQKMQKLIDTYNKKTVQVSGEGRNSTTGLILHRGHTADVGSLQSGLQKIFEAMEQFSASSFQMYEELHARIEEERLARANAKVP